jgi:hypothetical protein
MHGLLVLLMLGASPLNDLVSKAEALQQRRDGDRPLFAEYRLDFSAAPNFLGRTADVRIYQDANIYYVDETCASWSSRVWMTSERLVWLYSDAAGSFAFQSERQDRHSPEAFLQAKQFLICNPKQFDAELKQTLLSLKKIDRGNEEVTASLGDMSVIVQVTDTELSIRDSSTMRRLMTYSVAAGTPKWKAEIDGVLARIEKGEFGERRLGADFLFDAAMDQLAKDDAAEEKIDATDLPAVARLRGYLLPAGKFQVTTAIATGRGRQLFLEITNGERGFQTQQFRFPVTWTKEGKLLESPLPKHLIRAQKEIGGGVVVLVDNGPGLLPGTYFIDRSGQSVYVTGDHFKDVAFIEMVSSLKR